LVRNPEPRVPDPEAAVVDHFWTSVSLAAFCCYMLYPYFPLTPPRLLFHDLPGPAVPPFFRNLNFWILAHYGVPACVFPSGHVASVTATAIGVRSHLRRVGILFVVAAASIGVATVCLRYHYTADALAGAVVGWAASYFSNLIHGR
jgi:membrane-associated phospholipid phosphatase